MTSRNFRDTTRRTSNFRDETRRNRPRRLEPDRSRIVSPARSTRRYDQLNGYRYREADRSSDISQYNKSMAAAAPRSGGESESASSKFRWNNLLNAKKQMENPPSVKTTTKNAVNGFGLGYGYGYETLHPDSGVVPNGAPRNYGHNMDGKNELGIPKKSDLQMPNHQCEHHHHHQHHCQHHQHQHHMGYGVSVSQPNASSSCYFAEDVHVHVHGHGQMPKSSSIAEIPNGYGRVQQCSVPVMNRDFNYSEMQRSDNDDDDNEVHYRRNVTLKGDFRYQEFRRPSIVDSIVDRIDGVPCSQGNPLRKGVHWEQNVSPKYHDLTQSQSSKHCVNELLGSKYRQSSKHCVDEQLGSKYHQSSNHCVDELLGSEYHQSSKHCVDELLGSEYRQSSKHCVSEQLGCKWHDLTQSHSSKHCDDELSNYHQSSKHCVDELFGCRNMHPEYPYISNYQDSWNGSPVLNHDQYFYKHEEGNVSKTEELAMRDLDDVDMFELKCSGITNDNQVWTDFNGRLHIRHCAPDTFGDGEISFDEEITDVVQFEERSTYPLYSPPRNSRKSQMSIGKSIKKRLRPARTIPLPNSLVSSCRNVHARLGPRVVSSSESPYARKNMKSKILKRNLDFSNTATSSDLSDVKVKVKHIKRFKTEPPEDSKEFKQQVQNAFFKFVKLLNENPVQRRKYTDQGGVDTLSCTLCGSKSKEFANTHSLAMHAFNSTKARCRAEHLGFHKALCLLLGWCDTAASDGLWVQKMLPAAEASNLKSDLIIWPPVVVVHNSSITHCDPDKRMIVSVEGMEAILRGMGFGGGRTKVSRGKPGNFSILIVTFNATFSGLQEAERLHKFYADKKHGRVEFQQIDGSVIKDSNEETQNIPGNEESALYGYLGNAEDLDKLDFENKKHSVVKSKKEIQAIADATLRADRGHLLPLGCEHMV